ncbi:hypothetical protein M5C72_04885 [Companilactobacillus allii]|uniref:Uncharacterized protein n=1 Tax=Companilactobacillus allii TaxID=1847728 RepID=A0A1P8Q3T2_9LACO|nr:hypothetical protein [Companilactobacillus allii]APX72459.1 hypothetical protein BTM29_07810 [Companilactobacillus allii]USQ69557.1 hypothetical protein M5C72_04885 [Companilactobacillus allii]
MNDLEKLVDLSIQFGQMRVLVNREPTHWYVHEFLRLAGEMNEQKKSLSTAIENDKLTILINKSIISQRENE